MLGQLHSHQQPQSSELGTGNPRPWDVWYVTSFDVCRSHFRIRLLILIRIHIHILIPILCVRARQVK